ncbi:MAG: hypothetical protein JSU01_16185 [Bacteroidetes bacterium]|nr:hypothetical protein [Bacteroidota bacterium]
MLLFFCSIFGLSACKKTPQHPALPVDNTRGLLMGKWNLQKQKTIQVIDSVKETDTTYLASDINKGNLQFNPNNVFISVTYSSAGRDSSYGTYNVLKPDLNLSIPMAIFNDRYQTGYATVSAITLVSQSAKITLLNSSNLDIHLETVTVFTTNNGPLTFENEIDLYYTK